VKSSPDAASKCRTATVMSWNPVHALTIKAGRTTYRLAYGSEVDPNATRDALCSVSLCTNRSPLGAGTEFQLSCVSRDVAPCLNECRAISLVGCVSTRYPDTVPCKIRQVYGLPMKKKLDDSRSPHLVIDEACLGCARSCVR